MIKDKKISTNSSLLKNVLKYSLTSANTIFLFLLMIIAARFLGAEDFGKFSFALAFVFLFDPILDPGLYHFLIREISRNKDRTKQYLSHALTWKLMVAPLFFLLIYLTVNTIHDSQKTLYAVYLMTISLLLKSLKDPLRTSLVAHEYFGLDAMCLNVGGFTLLFFGALVLFTGYGLLWLCWVFVVVRFLDLILLGTIVKNKVSRFSVGFDFAFVKYLVINAVPIGAFYITLNLYNYIDTVMLSAFRTDAEVGWYNASYKIYEGLLIFPVIIGTAFMPRLSQHFKTDKEGFTRLLLRGLKYVIIFSILILLNGIFLSEYLIPLLFGSEFNKAIISLNILLVGALFVFVINFLQTAMITMDRQKIILSLALLGLLFNVALNLFLIPRYGYLGAASATVIVEFFIFLLLLICVSKAGQRIPWWKLFGKPSVSLLISVLLFWLLFPLDLFYLNLVLINLCFALLLYFMKYFDEDEISGLSKLLFSPKKFALNKSLHT